MANQHKITQDESILAEIRELVRAHKANLEQLKRTARERELAHQAVIEQIEREARERHVSLCAEMNIMRNEYDQVIARLTAIGNSQLF